MIPGFGHVDRTGQYDEKLKPSDPDLLNWFETNQAELETEKPVDHELEI